MGCGEFSQDWPIVFFTSPSTTWTRKLTVCRATLMSISSDDRKMRETLLDVQMRNMWNNLVLSGIAVRTEENPQATLYDFLQRQLKIPSDIVKTITFHQIRNLPLFLPAHYQ
ncbi:hypothetical protein XENORESO_021769 [Xenotaenia resolanae]|uniref:Uncharacterized protein n=1 Tax=Xenotaenia resolanae TaxID=208358 RepID=A0ABV0VXR0_9TELE